MVSVLELSLVLDTSEQVGMVHVGKLLRSGLNPLTRHVRRNLKEILCTEVSSS